MNSGKGHIFRRAWILLAIAAVAVVGASVYARRGKDFTEAAARKMGSVLERPTP